MIDTTIAVIIPYFNSDQWIGDLLESIKQQIIPSLEVVIVDNGSTAASSEALREIIKFYAPHLSIHYSKLETDDVSKARNYGLQHTNAAYVSFIDADDVLCGRYSLLYRAQFLSNHQNFDGIVGYPAAIDENGKLLWHEIEKSTQQLFITATQDPASVAELFCKNCVVNSKSSCANLFFATGSGMYRRSAVTQLPFYSDYNTEEDVEWMIRFLETHSLAVSMMPFHYRRYHSNQYSTSAPSEITQKVLEIAKDHLKKLSKKAV